VFGMINPSPSVPEPSGQLVVVSDTDPIASGSGMWVKVARSTRASTVYHYTDAQGLLGILTSKTLRASSFQSLNDSMELAYGGELIQEVFRTATLECAPEVVRLLGTIVSQLQAHIFSHDYFIVSASRQRDSLNQWRNYANGQGYAIGLRTGVYSQVIDRGYSDPQGAPGSLSLPIWMDVIYLEEVQRTAILDVFQELVAGEESTLGRAARDGSDQSEFVLKILGTLAATLKHPAFAAEEEVRLLVDRFEMTRTEFYAGRSGIVPYVEVAGPQAAGPNLPNYSVIAEREALEPLPIVELVCGPGEDFGRLRRQRVAGALLKRHGHAVTVDASMIPLVT
jgi:hypothetical protein